MRQLPKTAATFVIAGGALWLLWWLFVIPYQCDNRLKRASDDLHLILAAASNDIRVAALARRIIADLRNCTMEHPEDIGAQMILAGAYRALGRNHEAIAAYQAALKYDRRPELYLNLGQTQLEAGESTAALQNLVLACLYNPAYLDEVTQYHPEVKRAVDAYQLRLARSRP